MLPQRGQLVQQAHAVGGPLAQADDAARAHADARRAHRLQRRQPVLRRRRVSTLFLQGLWNDTQKTASSVAIRGWAAAVKALFSGFVHIAQRPPPAAQQKPVFAGFVERHAGRRQRVMGPHSDHIICD